MKILNRINDYDNEGGKMIMKDCVGMLLAGGEGKRLGMLTKTLAKPAVYFGGKYRIIDFTLSNCTNSGIRTVGIMTQYSPLELNKHIENGAAWDLNGSHGGTTILSPYIAKDGGDWYSGTADAIYQNIHFIDRYDPEYILVISGDHIYQMDYSKMLAHHKQTEASATISVIPVPWEEASRFGILNTKDDMRIYEFDEKPENPKNNLASMGIYIFTWKKLKEYLMHDAQNMHSSHDFGKDIIPAMVADDLRLFAYQFDGYWKDVGTIQSYWEANMDMLDEELQLQLNNPEWRVRTNEANFPPQYIGTEAVVRHSLINSGCWVCGTIHSSVLFQNVVAHEGCHIKESILHPNVEVGKNAVLERVIVMEDTIIPENAHIKTAEGEEPLIVDQATLNSLLALQ